MKKQRVSSRRPKKQRAAKPKAPKIKLYSENSPEYLEATGKRLPRATVKAPEPTRVMLETAGSLMFMSQENKDKCVICVDMSPLCRDMLADPAAPPDMHKQLCADLAGLPFRVVDDLPDGTIARFFDKNRKVVRELYA